MQPLISVKQPLIIKHLSKKQFREKQKTTQPDKEWIHRGTKSLCLLLLELCQPDKRAAVPVIMKTGVLLHKTEDPLVEIVSHPSLMLSFSSSALHSASFLISWMPLL